MKRWSTREVARLAGVSPATVSRVLNQRTSVTPELAAKVRAVVRSLGQEGAGQGRTGSVRKVGVAFPRRLQGYDTDPTGGVFYGQVLGGVDDVLHEGGHEHSLFPYDPAGPAGELVSRQMARFDGMILVGADTADELAREAARRNLPVIVVDKQVRGVDSVVSDNTGGAEEATAHVLAQGYRHLAYLCETFADPSFAARRHGFECAVEQSGLQDVTMHVAELGRGWLDAPGILADLFNAPERPLGVVAGNDMTALHILAVARARGLSIPDDIGLAGFDDVALASRSDPPLTTVRVDKAEMGRLAARRLLERIGSPDLLPITITMHIALTVRGSTHLRR